MYYFVNERKGQSIMCKVHVVRDQYKTGWFLIQFLGFKSDWKNVSSQRHNYTFSKSNINYYRIDRALVGALRCFMSGGNHHGNIDL